MSVPGQRPPCPVNCLQICIAQVQLTAYQNDRSAGTKVLDLRVPHGLYVVQGVGVGDGEAQYHNIGPEKCHKFFLLNL